MELAEAAAIIESATKDVFGTMLGTELRSQPPFLDPTPLYASEIIALIGLAGMVQGYVSLHCSVEQAGQFTARLLGIDSTEIGAKEEIKDAIGEIVNMVAGNVKTILSRRGVVEIALPSVCMGARPEISVKGSSGVVVPFADPAGVFHVELVAQESAR